MNLFGKSIKTIFVISIITITSVLLILQTAFNVYSFKTNMEDEVQAKLSAKSGEIVNAFNSKMLQVSEKTEALASLQALQRMV